MCIALIRGMDRLERHYFEEVNYQKIGKRKNVKHNQPPQNF
ncbi:MAG: hypothetical protein ACP5HI_06635 [Caldimicrobium sp.]